MRVRLPKLSVLSLLLGLGLACAAGRMAVRGVGRDGQQRRYPTVTGSPSLPRMRPQRGSGSTRSDPEPTPSTPPFPSRSRSGVVQPASSGIGGGGFALVWDAAQRKVTALDFREVAPGALDPAALEYRSKAPVASGPRKAHRRTGRSGGSRRAAPAIRSPLVRRGCCAGSRHRRKRLLRKRSPGSSRARVPLRAQLVGAAARALQARRVGRGRRAAHRQSPARRNPQAHRRRRPQSILHRARGSRDGRGRKRHRGVCSACRIWRRTTRPNASRSRSPGKVTPFTPCHLHRRVGSCSPRPWACSARPISKRSRSAAERTHTFSPRRFAERSSIACARSAIPLS